MMKKKKNLCSSKNSSNSIFTQDSFKDDLLKQNENNDIDFITNKDANDDYNKFIFKEKERKNYNKQKKKIIIIIVILFIIVIVTLGILFLKSYKNLNII